jgi:hypothetical protein
MLNYGLRHVLAYWHPALEDWEVARPADRSRGEHERSWNRAGELRNNLNATREVLAQYASLMASACGVPDLIRDGMPSVDTSGAVT